MTYVELSAIEYVDMFNSLFNKIEHNEHLAVTDIVRAWLEDNQDHIEYIGMCEVTEQILNNKQIGHIILNELLLDLLYTN